MLLFSGDENRINKPLSGLAMAGVSVALTRAILEASPHDGGGRFVTFSGMEDGGNLRPANGPMRANGIDNRCLVCSVRCE